MALSADVGRMCAPIALILPSYLMLVMGGVAGLRAALPAAIICGVAFAGMQFVISNYVGPFLGGLLSAIGAMCAMLLLLKFWTPPGDEKRACLAPYRRRSLPGVESLSNAGGFRSCVGHPRHQSVSPTR